ncbi:MAG: peptide ABC transporter substrate-binding protein, partial [Thermorudis peleae]|nr:peptide ABC transporter substrate-binding protein [Thermorudis peleae]
MYPLWLQTLQHHLAAGHITRREFVRRAALLGFSAPAISAALAACGGGGGQASPTAQGNAASTPAIRIEQNVTATPSPATPTPAASPAGKSGGSVNL